MLGPKRPEMTGIDLHADHYLNTCLTAAGFVTPSVGCTTSSTIVEYPIPGPKPMVLGLIFAGGHPISLGVNDESGDFFRNWNQG